MKTHTEIYTDTHTQRSCYYDYNCADVKKLQVVQAALADILSYITLFWAKYPVLFNEDGKRRVEYWELRLDKRDLRQEYEEWII